MGGVLKFRPEQAFAREESVKITKDRRDLLSASTWNASLFRRY